jgi:hypothetical protein
MFKRLQGILLLMSLFWVMIIEASWLLAKVYMPWVKVSLPGVEVDVLVWVGVVFVFAIILLFFRSFLHSLFWYTSCKGKIED